MAAARLQDSPRADRRTRVRLEKTQGPGSRVAAGRCVGPAGDVPHAGAVSMAGGGDHRTGGRHHSLGSGTSGLPPRRRAGTKVLGSGRCRVSPDSHGTETEGPQPGGAVEALSGSSIPRLFPVGARPAGARQAARRSGRPYIMKWVTWENVGVDRMACAWLIRRHIDRAAEFLFIPRGAELPKSAQPFDIPGTELSHHDGHC